MAGRPQQVTDDEILNAVGETVSAIGPSKLTVAAVASRVGVTAPAVRQRFGSTRDLLLAFASRSANAASDTFDAEAATTEDPLAGLIEGLAACGSFTNRTEMAHHLALLHLDLTDPDLSESAAQHSRKLLAAVRRQVASAAKYGQINARTNIDDLAESVYTTFNGALLTWAIDGEGISRDWLIERLHRTIEPHRNN